MLTDSVRMLQLNTNTINVLYIIYIKAMMIILTGGPTRENSNLILLKACQ